MVDPLVAAAIPPGIGAAANLAAAGVDAWSTNKANEFSWEKQKKLAQNQVQWRVQDAVKAGLHPLAALGMSPTPGPAAAVGNSASFVSQMGQNISRAVDSMLTPEDKLAGRMALAQVETAEVNRDIAKAQLAGAQKALLSHGATPGIASRIPAPPVGVKADRLSSSGGEFWRDASGSVHRLPGAVDAQWLEEKIGESADVVGAHRGAGGWLADMGAKGVWPGVLGF